VHRGLCQSRLGGDPRQRPALLPQAQDFVAVTDDAGSATDSAFGASTFQTGDPRLIISSFIAPRSCSRLAASASHYGTTSASVVTVAAGDHTITVRKKGYVPWERKVRVSSGRVSIKAELEKLSAQ
jgi:hypothetical protein